MHGGSKDLKKYIIYFNVEKATSNIKLFDVPSHSLRTILATVFHESGLFVIVQQEK